MTLLDRPRLVVEVAFNVDSNNAAAVAAMTDADWVDITPWVRAIPTLERSKRSTELDRFEAGTAKLTLDNSDGRFSPTNVSSPYAPEVTVYRMIRIRAVWATVTYPLWRGYVERWPSRWVDPAQGVVDLECVDAMAIAAQIGMSSAYTAEVLADAPTYYYPLSEESGAQSAANQSTTPQENATIFHDSLASGTDESWTFGSQIDGLVGADSNAGLGFTPSTTSPYPGYGLRLPLVDLDWSGWTIDCWMQMTLPGEETAAAGQILAVYDAVGGPTQIHLDADLAGTLSFTITTPDGVSNFTTGVTYNLGNGGLHYISLVYTSAKHLNIYVNDIAVGFLNLSSSTFTGIRSCVMQFGSRDTAGSSLPVKRSDSGWRPLSGVIAQVAVYSSEQSYDRHEARYAAGLIPLVNQLTGTRAAALLGYASWPSALQDVQSGNTVMQPATGIAGRSLLENLQDIADTENGTLFTTVDGKLAFHSRNDRLTQIAPAAVFGSDVPGGEIPYQLDGLQFDYDPTLVFNDVTVEQRDGAKPQVFDAGSILTYFNRALSAASLARDSTEVTNTANWLLARYAQPALRVEQITIDVGSLGPDVTNLWPTILALDLNKRARIAHRPMGQPADTLDGYVDQLTHEIDPDAGTWRLVLQISPAIQDYWIVADTTGGDHTWDANSVVGQTTRLSY